MRFDDWEKRLSLYLSDVQPFAWGTNDCCQFTLGKWSELATGVNHFAQHKYNSELGAAKILKKFDGVEGLANLYLGESKPPTLAQRGDIVLFEHDEGKALGICIGAKIAAVGEFGLLLFPMSLAQKAWSLK
jgi:hypothetical protein